MRGKKKITESNRAMSTLYPEAKCHSFVNVREKYSQICKFSKSIYFLKGHRGDKW